MTHQGDGTCAVEVQSTYDGLGDAISPEVLKARAKYLANKCVRDFGSGGTVNKLGRSATQIRNLASFGL